MTKAILVHAPGGPEVLSFENVEIQPPGPGEVLLRHTAIGVNFIDTYLRTGFYPWGQPAPVILGAEAAGVVEEIGEGVSHLQPGDRVAYVSRLGAYSEKRLMPADRLVKIPDGISDETAAAMMLKGMTAHYLLHGCFSLKKGDLALIHAAAGGVGSIAGQWGRHIGATMIGTAGSDEKTALAKTNGYAHTINYKTENFVERVKEITDGAGVHVVYDSVGQDTYPYSLDCLRRRGMWVCFGQSSGIIKNFEIGHLAQRGSLFATRPTLFDYTATPEDLQKTAAALFEVVLSGAVKVVVNQRFALKDAAEAHRALESRKTTGSTVLIP